jgi:hypothetical protein
MIRVSKIADPHRLDDVARPGNDLLDGVGTLHLAPLHLLQVEPQMRRLASLRCTTFPHGQSPRTFTSAFAEVFRVCAEVSVGKGNRRRSRGLPGGAEGIVRRETGKE